MSFAVWDFIFQLSRFQIRSSDSFSPVPHKPPQEPHTASTGPIWGFAGVVSLPRPLTGQKSPHRAGFVFPPQNELTPPPKGGGVGYRLSWVRRIHPARSKLGHARPTGPVRGFAGVVLLPSHLTGHKSPHRGEFGFGLLAGASKEDHPPFRQSRIRTQAEEKNTSAPLF